MVHGGESGESGESVGGECFPLSPPSPTIRKKGLKAGKETPLLTSFFQWLLMVLSFSISMEISLSLSIERVVNGR